MTVSCIPRVLPGQVTWTLTVQALVVSPQGVIVVLTVKGMSPACWVVWLLAYRVFLNRCPGRDCIDRVHDLKLVALQLALEDAGGPAHEVGAPAAFQAVGCMESSARIPTVVRNSVIRTSTIVIPRLLHAVRNMGPSCDQHIDRTGGIAAIGQDNGPCR